MSELFQPGNDELLERARQARLSAHCPYSGYAVGAAVVTVEGAMFTGCNVENVSYGLTICAERNAIAAAVTGGMQPGQLRAISLVAGRADAAVPAHQAVPCGACLQVIAEFAAPDCAVICAPANADAAPTVRKLSELLPSPFGSS